MSTFTEKLTIAGENMLAAMLTSGTPIKFTKIVLGNGTASTSQIPTLDNVISPIVNLDIYSVTNDASHNIIITSIFQNSMITSGFYYREKGIYATDGTQEVLFMYANSGSLAEWIEPSTSSSIIEKRISSIITFTESDQVNIELQTGLYATEETSQEILKAVNNISFDTTDLSKEITSKATKDQVNNIDEKIGESTNDSTATTLFGKVKSIIDKITNIDTFLQSFKTESDAKRNDIYDYIGTTWDNTDTILYHIGERNDSSASDTTGTIFGKLNKLLSTWTTTLATKVNNIGSTSDSGATTTSGTVMGKLNKILSSNLISGSSTIKSVQRGTNFLSWDDTDQNPVDITISAVNTNKTVCNLLTSMGTSGSSTYTRSVSISLLNSTTLRIQPYSSNNPSQTYVSWEVIEYV